VQGIGLPIAELGGQYNTPLIKSGGINATTDHTFPGIWIVTPTPAAGSAVYDMALYGRNYSTAGGNAFSILKRNTFECVSNVWTLSGNYFGSSNIGNVLYAKRTGMSGFSKFAIAPHNLPLPIDLLFFNAECDNANNRIKIFWTTTSEINNDYFTIERSTDGFDFEPIATIDGAGNSSSTNQYSFIDDNFPGGTCYYRLKQTDYNGQFNYVDVISVNCSSNLEFELINMIPNLAKENLYVIFKDGIEEPIYINVYDMIGKKIYTEQVISKYGINKTQLDMTYFSSGVYFINISNGKKNFAEKIEKRY